MKERDKKIIDILENFRVMGREDIEEVFFSHLDFPKNSANRVLLRLVQSGHIEVNKAVKPHIYFPSPSTLKKDSQKIPHYLRLVSVFREIFKFNPDVRYIIEPHFLKGLAEPDAFCELLPGLPLFIEYQRSFYSSRLMNDKIKRYERLYESGEWKSISPDFPDILIITKHRYNIHSNVVRVIQTRDINDILSSLKPMVD